MGMYNNTIAITANRSSEEPWRLMRLERVIGYVCAVSETNEDQGVLEDVVSLHDHKGNLTVKWNQAPTEQRKDYFVRAWESIIGDGADNVEHELG